MLSSWQVMLLTKIATIVAVALLCWMLWEFLWPAAVWAALVLAIETMIFALIHRLR